MSQTPRLDAFIDSTGAFAKAATRLLDAEQEIEKLRNQVTLLATTRDQLRLELKDLQKRLTAMGSDRDTWKAAANRYRNRLDSKRGKPGKPLTVVGKSDNGKRRNPPKTRERN